VTNEENDMLEAPFSEVGIKKAIDNSYAEGAPGKDGFFLPILSKILASNHGGFYVPGEGF
jgi:hypothetical protein